MEQIYQQKVEESMNKALPNIIYYSSIGLLSGSILETIMPEFNEKKDTVALFLEIFAQLTIIVFLFMFITSKGGVRYGLLVYILTMIGTQPSLFLKMKALRDVSLGIKSKKSNEENEENFEEIEDSTNTEEKDKLETDNQPVDNTANAKQTQNQAPQIQNQAQAPQTQIQATQSVIQEPLLEHAKPSDTFGSASAIDSLPFSPSDSSFGMYASPF
tara:strand:- start:1037 stop:1681 length:645 start_codon:yes stop_codon:yes gene_type:complete